jgi:hypothetical protein
MKTNVSPGSKPQTVQTHKQKGPENKDNLDSRKNEEQEVKGDDVTNNKKPTKESGMKQKDQQ